MKSAQTSCKPVIILHGGAGSITRASLPPKLYQLYVRSLTTYLVAANDVLKSGSNAVDAVVHAVSLMEDDPLFNCGRGSVFTRQGQIEMEASLMVTTVQDRLPETTPGRIKKCAAVSMIRHTRHPIQLAREVLRMADDSDGFGDKTEMHAHLSGSDVESYGEARGLGQKGPDWFWTKRRWEEHLRGLKGHSPEWYSQRMSNGMQADGAVWDPDVLPNGQASGSNDDEEQNYKVLEGLTNTKENLPSQGTVGAMCIDQYGTLAVATSTGGLTNKASGRIGDTPTVGAGFWAERWTEVLQVGDEVEIENDHNHDHERKRSRNATSSLRFPSLSSTTYPTSVVHKLAKTMKQELNYWLGDCLPLNLDDSSSNFQIPESNRSSHRYLPVPQSQDTPSYKSVDKAKSRKETIKTTRAVALSGTGNGDSFLRTAATRVTAAIYRFDRLNDADDKNENENDNGSKLSKAVTRVAGPGGLLQLSAEDRWDYDYGYGYDNDDGRPGKSKTGEGEGGIIGVEAIKIVTVVEDENGGDDDEDDERNKGKEMETKIEAKVVWDFNCGGMWRAYYEKVDDDDDDDDDEDNNSNNGDGKGRERVKVMVFREEY